MRGKVLRLILGQAVRYSLVGLALGLAGSVALGRLMRAMLFQVEPGDPATLIAVSAFLLAAVVLAAAGPAFTRRASSLWHALRTNDSPAHSRTRIAHALRAHRCCSTISCSSKGKTPCLGLNHFFSRPV